MIASLPKKYKVLIREANEKNKNNLDATLKATIKAGLN